MDFVTGRDAQTVISMRLDRRSVRMDVEEPSYLPDKDIHIIYNREDEVNSEKGTWLEHLPLFTGCLRRMGHVGRWEASEEGTVFRHELGACLSPTPLSRRSYYPGMRHAFMTVLLHGKRSGNIEHNRYVAGLLDNVLARYEGDAGNGATGCFDNIRDPDGRLN